MNGFALLLHNFHLSRKGFQYNDPSGQKWKEKYMAKLIQHLVPTICAFSKSVNTDPSNPFNVQKKEDLEVSTIIKVDGYASNWFLQYGVP